MGNYFDKVEQLEILGKMIIVLEIINKSKFEIWRNKFYETYEILDERFENSVHIKFNIRREDLKYLIRLHISMMHKHPKFSITLHSDREQSEITGIIIDPMNINDTIIFSVQSLDSVKKFYINVSIRVEDE